MNFTPAHSGKEKGQRFCPECMRIFLLLDSIRKRDMSPMKHNDAPRVCRWTLLVKRGAFNKGIASLVA